ncbi:uncharacterized protein LOC117815683 isoform X2 [Notolabrus celidotus]|uniref:uncharacterized protein LOC117815683 isoform X2 n=1 Tax=Notolabrus celidotus TaxID=1203425 RepID=UPI0014903BC8|nr:uncharacterized protein LOC117815683 isoform X2 [Notolabrus celidotus]
MSGRLAFQTQLASIMEVLANAAVAEICKLVDDDYAVVSLQMSQCQRENRALKRKLHLLELKMARGNAERRLREAAGSSSRTRVQVTAVDRLRESASTSSCTDGGFGDRMDVVVWTGGAAAGGTELIHSEHAERKSSDVELVDPELDEVALVKGEKVEANISRVKVSKEEEDVVSLIRDDGVVECVPSRAAEQRPGLQQQDTQSTPSQIQNQTQTQTQSVTPGSSRRRCAGSRGVEGQALKEISSSMCVQTQDHNPGTAFQGPLLTVTAPPSAPDSKGPHFSDGMDDDQSVHITIQRGRSLPKLSRCSSCCWSFHCPFCSSALCRPTKLSKVKTHLENHFNRAVLHEGYTIHRCGLGCRKQLHYHCVYCQSTLSRKPDFIKHLGLCKQKHKTTTPPVPAPTNISTSPTTATAHLVPSASSATSTGSPALTTSPGRPGQRVRVKPVMQIKCPVCQVVMNKRNLKKHIERKHTSQHENKSAAARLDREPGDPGGETCTVNKSILGPRMSASVQTEGGEEDPHQA